jgi:protein-disulfide isomerase
MLRIPAALALVALLSLALAAPQLGHPHHAPNETGLQRWRYGATPTELTSDHGDATLTLRNRILYRVNGSVAGGMDGARALAELIAAARGGDAALVTALEGHLLASAGVPPFTRIDNTLLTLREEGDRVAFEYAFIEFSNGDFRPSRHALHEGDTVVRLYGDLACAACGTFVLVTLPELLDLAAGAGARVEYHHAPMSAAGAGVLAAEASECVAAAHEGSFPTYLERLSATRNEWAPLPSPQAYFVELAETLGLAAPGLEECITERLASREVAIAAESARNLGFRDRPTVFVGGIMMSDPRDRAEFERLLQLVTPPPALEIVPMAPGEPPLDQESPDEPEDGREGDA